MSIGVGINGVLGGGGGVPSLADPSSFADAIALYRSDAGITLVSDKVDAWADQSGNGYDLSAVFAANRVGQVPNKGKYDFKDLSLKVNTNFKTTSFASGSYTEFTLDFVFTPTANQYWFSLGDGNDPNYTFNIFTGTNNITASTEAGGTVSSQYYGYDKADQTCMGTFVFDGSETGTDRLKFYLDGVEVTVGGAIGAAWPATLVEPDSLEFILSAWSGTSTGIVGYVGIWDRVLTGDEIAANQAWKEEIWS
jgi:hypothetical protein